MNIKIVLLFLLLTLQSFCQTAPNKNVWNGKQCAVVLTYDDALNVHLDNAIPILDSLNLKATFYISAYADGYKNRLNEWRKVAQNGHELGNHTLYHPCDATPKDRSWVAPENDLSKYSLKQLIREVEVTNTILESIDQKNERTFAFTCGDKLVENKDFTNDLSSKFTALRGVTEKINAINEVNLNDINSIAVIGENENQLIQWTKKAMESGKLLVFLFHGVGGEHSMNISLKQHSKLLHFLKDNENKIWITTMNDAAKLIKTVINK
jgi:peptidoglycan/xylan/chitin deacetylase (PgdA/CDA1 family)